MPVKQTQHMVRRYAHVLVQLPAYPDPWRMRNYDCIDRTLVLVLRDHGVIERAIREDSNHEAEWRLKRGYHTDAQQYMDQVDRFPCCGGTGISNQAGSIVCSNCGEFVGEELAREVLS